MSKESWFAQEMKNATSGLSAVGSAKYLFIDTITTKSNAVS